MKQTKMVRLVSFLLAFFMLFTAFSGYTHPVIAESTDEEKPEMIEFKIVPNKTKTVNHSVVTKDGTDCYQVGDIVAFDVYLETKNASVGYFYVSLRISDRLKSYITILTDKTEIGDNEHFSTNSGHVYFNADKDKSVVLNNDSAIKVGTFYCEIKDSSLDKQTLSDEKFEITPNIITIQRLIEGTNYYTNLTTTYNSYKFYASDKPTQIEVTSQNIEIQKDEEVEIESKVCSSKYDELYERGVLQEVTYTSEKPDIAKVLSNGKIYGVSAGTTKITIASKIDENVKTQVDVTVKENANAKPITELTFENPPENNKMNVGEKRQLTVKIEPNDATNKSLHYSSDRPDVIKVSSDGTIEAVGEGSATVKVEASNGVSTTCTIEVKNIVSKVEILNPIDILSAQAQSTYQIKFRVFNEDGVIDESLNNLVRIKCSDADNIRVNENNSITNTTVKIGDVKVTAYVGNIEDSFWVYYSPVVKDSKSFSIVNKKTTMAKGDSYQLKTNIEPGDASAKLVKFYASDPSYVSIDKNGKITALKATEHPIKITAFCGGREETFELTILEHGVPLENIILNGESGDKISIEKSVKETKEVKFTFEPEETTDDKNIDNWVSTDQDIASINIDYDTGTITIKEGYKPGVATITIMKGDITKEIEVTSYGVGVKGSSLVFVDRDSEYQIEPMVFLPEDEEYTITYESNNPDAASVDENGLVHTGHIEGEESKSATITITLTTASGKKYINELDIGLTIRVRKITIFGNINGSQIENYSGKVIEILEGESIYFEGKIEPSDALNYASTIKVSDETVLEKIEDGFGFWKALKKGRVTITAVSTENSNITDSCTVVVVDKIHGNTKTVPAEESTCIKHGHGEYVICQDCGTIISGTDEELPLAAHKGGIATCNSKAVCEVCKQEYGFFDINNHINTELRNVKKATTEQEGYTGDRFCLDCNKLLEKGEIIPILAKEGEPKEPEKEPEVLNPEVPNTGDNFNMTVWIITLLISFVGILGIGNNLKKNKNKK